MSILKIVKTFSAAAPLDPNRMVLLSAEGEVSLSVSNATPVFGVTEFGCENAGDALGIAIAGPGILVELGAVLTAGTYVGADTEGKAVAAVVGKYQAGRILEDGNIGDLVQLILNDAVYNVPV